MPKLFDDDVSDEDVKINTNTEYANKYNQWRKKEELYHLEQKYKSKLNSDSNDDSSSSDEELENIEESLEKSFFKTLSCLKNKDPKIYDENVVFFEENDSGDEEKVEKKPKKSKPLTIPEYERQLLLKQGNFSDEDEREEMSPRVESPTYAEEQRRLQESLKQVVKEADDGEDGWGGLFVKREKSKQEKEQEEADYRKWLKGHKEKLDDDTDASELKPLRDYWNNPDLNESEAYLRDYLLNRRYLEKEDENHIPTYEEIVHDSDDGLSEDEKAIERQEEFEVKYNFRYEEPDQEFIKRYPRTMEQSVRKTDDRRKVKRAETKERKLEKKKEREEELKQLKLLKLSEIQERIKKLKQITGNEEMAFQDHDIEGDFDPEAHDKRMQELFNDDYYGVGDEEKPEFPDLEEELGPWKDKNELNDEDENFNMDCDYDPSTSKKSKKEKKKRNRPGKTPKKVDEETLENDENFKEFEDEYYKLDYEDMIGDIPCRFKYRKVVPNSFGLTVEEILLAKEQELNRWCSLKKIVQIRPEHIEKYDVFAYQKKARNEELKKKILPSLYADLHEEKIDDNEENEHDFSETTSKNKNQTFKSNFVEKNLNDIQDENSKKKNKKRKNLDESYEANEKLIDESHTSNVEEHIQEEISKKKSKKRKNADEHNKTDEKAIDATLKKRKKHKNDTKEKEELINEKYNPVEIPQKKKKKKILNKLNSNEKKQNDSNTSQSSSPDKTNLCKENSQNNEPTNKISRRQRKNEKRKLKKLNPSVEQSETIQNEPTNKNDTKSYIKNPKTFKKKQNLNNTGTSSGNDSNIGKNRKRKFSTQNSDAGQGKNIPNKKKKFDKDQSVKDVKFSNSRLEAYGINPKKFKNKIKYKKNL